MESETLKWLSEKVPAFGNLSELEKMAILDFALLWTFFESRCLSKNANMKSIQKFVQKLPEVTAASREVEKVAAYFRTRYTENGAFSERYHRLHLERSKNPQEVTHMLKESADCKETLIGCLAILFRYRNNLFHGEKWEHELQDQQENFERSAALLRWLMDNHA